MRMDKRFFMKGRASGILSTIKWRRPFLRRFPEETRKRPIALPGVRILAYFSEGLGIGIPLGFLDISGKESFHRFRVRKLPILTFLRSPHARKNDESQRVRNRTRKTGVVRDDQAPRYAEALCEISSDRGTLIEGQNAMVLKENGVIGYQLRPFMDEAHRAGAFSAARISREDDEIFV